MISHLIVDYYTILSYNMHPNNIKIPTTTLNHPQKTSIEDACPILMVQHHTWVLEESPATTPLEK